MDTIGSLEELMMSSMSGMLSIMKALSDSSILQFSL